jgi:hypothetical protein
MIVGDIRRWIAVFADPEVGKTRFSYVWNLAVGLGGSLDVKVACILPDRNSCMLLVCPKCYSFKCIVEFLACSSRMARTCIGILKMSSCVTRLALAPRTWVCSGTNSDA